ncbi:MAG: hypothetical protein J5535_05895, partial [Firmicutes bacterium]|nr:hypothetical protein [Bacillota bacterium]
MKLRKISALMLALCLLIGCCACGVPNNGNSGNNSNGSGNNSSVPDRELTPAEISDLAMENFIKKLQAGNYVVSSGNGLVTNAFSPEQVYFVYPHEGWPLIYAYMTLKDETFATYIEDNETGDIEFVSPGDAISALAELLPNNWITITGGNLMELFYNDVDKPLEFTSNDENVKYTLSCLGGYGQPALELMQEVRMVMDAQDPTAVRFTAEILEDGMYHYDDLDLTIKFGEAAGEPHIEAW